MRLFLVDGQIAICAEAPDDSIRMELGWFPDRDSKITAIDFRTKTYKVRDYDSGTETECSFPEKWHRDDDLKWEVHRFHTTTMPGHKEHHR